MTRRRLLADGYDSPQLNAIDAMCECCEELGLAGFDPRRWLYQNLCAAIKREFQHFGEWLDDAGLFDDATRYDLLDMIGVRPTCSTGRDEFLYDKGSEATVIQNVWEGEAQRFWLCNMLDDDDDDDDTYSVVLANDRERAAFSILVRLDLSYPEFDRETYEAFQHAISKDD
jgi:hypothetical protein